MRDRKYREPQASPCDCPACRRARDPVKVHGTDYSYKRGCRCDACTFAHNEHEKKTLAQRKGNHYHVRPPDTKCRKCGALLQSRNPGPLCNPCSRQTLDALFKPRDWEANARCLTHAWKYPREVFFPETNQGVLHDRARTCCMACPVRRECLTLCFEAEDAGLGPQVGIWGGTTQDQRTKAKHLPDCDRSFPKARLCKGCRPVEERVELLMYQAERQARDRGLIEQGEVA